MGPRPGRRVLPCGDVGLLVEVEDLDEVLALHAELSAVRLEGVVDLVAAARTVLVHIDPARTTVARVAEQVESLTPRPRSRQDAGAIEVPVTYDGEDLPQVAALTGLGERGVVEAHTGQVWTVAFPGFAPGFGYLVGQDRRLDVPRRATPRTRVPAGAVALAGQFSGVYPHDSPGGWQVIGTTDLRMWDLDREPPALLTPGTRVAFVEVR